MSCYSPQHEINVTGPLCMHMALLFLVVLIMQTYINGIILYHLRLNKGTMFILLKEYESQNIFSVEYLRSVAQDHTGWIDTCRLLSVCTWSCRLYLYTWLCRLYLWTHERAAFIRTVLRCDILSEHVKYKEKIPLY